MFSLLHNTGAKFNNKCRQLHKGMAAMHLSGGI